MYFRNYGLWKTWLNKCLKSSVSEDKQHGKRSQELLKSVRQHLYHTQWSLWRKLCWEKSLLVICKMLGLLVNTLTADDKFSDFNRVILTQPIQMQLSKKQKLFLIFFVHFWNLDKKLNILKKVMTIIASVFPKLTTLKDVVG